MTQRDFTIQTPCTKAWDEMRGDEAQRHCDQCEQQVHNLAGLPHDEAESLLARTNRGESLCLRIEVQRDGRCKTAGSPTVTRFRPTRIAAAALAFGAGLAGCSTVEQENGAMKPGEEKLEAADEEEWIFVGSSFGDFPTEGAHEEPEIVPLLGSAVNSEFDEQAPESESHQSTD